MDDLDPLDPFDFGAREAQLREQRREAVKALRERGHSLRAIAEATGVTHPTVLEDLRASGSEVDMNEVMHERAGADADGTYAGDPLDADQGWAAEVDVEDPGPDMSDWMRQRARGY